MQTVTNKQLMDILSQYPDDYVMQLSIGEETACLTHLFIDSDNGVIEMTNYEDDDDNVAHILDHVGNYVYIGNTILMFDIHELVHCKVTAIDTNEHFFTVHNNEYNVDHTYKYFDGTKITNIVKYEW